MPTYVMLAVAGASLLAVLYWGRQRVGESVARAKEEASRILRDAHGDAERLKREALFEAKEEQYRLRSDFEEKVRSERKELSFLENRLLRTEAKLDQTALAAEQQERELTDREHRMEALTHSVEVGRAKYEEGLGEQRKVLVRAAGLSVEDAKRQLFRQLEQEVRREAAKLVRRIEEDAREQAEVVACRYIVEAIQRSAADHAAENTVSVVDLANDDLKGRIIGREGRNIRAVETATGVDLIVDDTPGAIILSGFDPIRREIAKGTIQRLVPDGRIHPARVEEVVARYERSASSSSVGSSTGPARPERAPSLQGSRLSRRLHGEGMWRQRGGRGEGRLAP